MTSGSPSPDPREMFTKLFGVSKEELERQGIDPHTYALTHVRGVLKDPAKKTLALPDSLVNREAFFAWGFRAYVALGSGFVFLLLTKLPRALSWIGWLAAIASITTALALWSVATTHQRRYLKACRAEGIEPEGRTNIVERYRRARQ